MNAVPGSSADRLLTASLVVAPVLYLVANILYALRGWESDSAGGVFHVLGATAYTLVLVRVATWTSGTLTAVLLAVGSIGIAGNVAYGFDTIHVALGDVSLVDRDGAATLIKPLGLGFPLMLLLCAIALRGVAPRWTVSLIGLAALAFPVANIGDVPALGIADSIAAVIGFGALAVRRTPAPPPPPLPPAADSTVSGSTTARMAS
ncbi:hypothetical protein AB1484_11705 [Parafrankia sp. FMc6]|uniref:hypothetical protein n=1 Tax=Parafrankia TaxID=2994362 RepID=UPI000DA4C3A4|nr:hypothetical protein [Parafrankia sp. Ea1.12]SQD99456.1 conserved membrane hypothetical protein [Parafrankia sp. Ea1.12]